MKDYEYHYNNQMIIFETQLEKIATKELKGKGRLRVMGQMGSDSIISGVG